MAQSKLKDWLENLKEIWEGKNPNEIINICAEKFSWHETPFDNPFTTREQLLKEWQTVLNQENISVSYKILCASNNLGIAQWHATFTRLPSKEKAELDGIFEVLLDDQGKCVEFHQWYDSKGQ